jgi:hypothetical protein
MPEITDPDILKQLNSESHEVTDPALLSQLNAETKEPGRAEAFVRGMPNVPIIGSTLKDWAQKGAAASQAILPPEGKYSHAPTFGERYDENLGREKQIDIQAQQQHPTATKYGGIAGGMLAAVPAFAAAPAIGTAVGATGVAAPIVGGGLVGGGLGAGETLAHGGTATEALTHGALGAGLGAAGGALPLAAPYIGKAFTSLPGQAAIASGIRGGLEYAGFPKWVSDYAGDVALAKILKHWDNPAEGVGKEVEKGVTKGMEPTVKEWADILKNGTRINKDNPTREIFVRPKPPGPEPTTPGPNPAPPPGPMPSPAPAPPTPPGSFPRELMPKDLKPGEYGFSPFNKPQPSPMPAPARPLPTPNPSPFPTPARPLGWKPPPPSAPSPILATPKPPPRPPGTETTLEDIRKTLESLGAPTRPAPPQPWARATRAGPVPPRKPPTD